MVALAAAGVAVALASGHGRFGAALALGAAVSILAYFWLHQTVAAALDRLGSASGKAPKGMVIKFLIRYPLALGVVYLFYKTNWLPFQGVLLGLFVPVAGAVAECLLVLGEYVFRSKQQPIGHGE